MSPTPAENGPEAAAGPGFTPPPAREQVWRFRGYELRPSEFTSAMTAYYQAEIERSNTWRMRLDATTNWAVITTGVVLIVVLSGVIHPFAIILATFLVTLFCWIEARRYRYYELWSYRARLMETDFFAAMLVPPFSPHPEWAESLAESLLEPQWPISMWEAFGRRFRRNYQWLFLVLGLGWMLTIYLTPEPAASLSEFVLRAAVGGVMGEIVVAVGLLYNLALFVIGLATSRLTQASGEILPKFSSIAKTPPLRPEADTTQAPSPGRDPAFQPRRRQSVLAFIVTNRPKDVAARIMSEMRRGVTALHGTGMYTQVDRDVLFVALTVTETAYLKVLVQAEDPNAFVVVTSVHEVLGRGFQPLAKT